MPVLLVSFATVLCLATALVLRRNFAGDGSVAVSGFDGTGVLAGFIFTVGAAVFFGPAIGLLLVAALLLHELGHVLAYRMLGHDTAQFRLIPLLSDVPISDRPLKTDGEEFFVSLMGPAFCLAPMALAMALSTLLAPGSPQIAEYLRLFAITSGAVNFISLLPFWPLDGGRCARTAVVNFWPALAPAMAIFMSTAMISASLRTGSVMLMVVAAVGAHSLFRSAPARQQQMAADTGLIALAAYAFTMAAHFSAGWLLFQAYF